MILTTVTAVVFVLVSLGDCFPVKDNITDSKLIGKRSPSHQAEEFDNFLNSQDEADCFCGQDEEGAGSEGLRFKSGGAGRIQLKCIAHPPPPPPPPEDAEDEPPNYPGEDDQPPDQYDEAQEPPHHPPPHHPPCCFIHPPPCHPPPHHHDPVTPPLPPPPPPPPPPPTHPPPPPQENTPPPHHSHCCMIPFLPCPPGPHHPEPQPGHHPEPHPGHHPPPGEPHGEPPPGHDWLHGLTAPPPGHTVPFPHHPPPESPPGPPHGEPPPPWNPPQSAEDSEQGTARLDHLGENISRAVNEKVKKSHDKALWYNGPNVCTYETEPKKSSDKSKDSNGKTVITNDGSTIITNTNTIGGSSININNQICNYANEFKLVCKSEVTKNGKTEERTRTYQCCNGYVGTYDENHARKCVPKK